MYESTVKGTTKPRNLFCNIAAKRAKEATDDTRKLLGGALNIVICGGGRGGGDFAGIASKLEKVGLRCSSFNPFPSLPSVATDDWKQFQCLNIVLNNKTRPLFFIFN